MLSNSDDSTTDLYALFDALRDRLLTEVRSKDGEVKASLLAVARQFLADNGINARSRADLGKGLRALVDAQAMPFTTPN